jgi:hypothetical protein
MQNQAVSKRQLLGIENDSVGILDNGIASNAPALVADDAPAMLTLGLRGVLVAVVPTGCGIG